MAIDYGRLFAALPSPHAILDRDFNYVAANAAYEAAVMRPEAELIGRNMFDLFPNDGEGGHRLRASFARVLETDKPDTLAFIPYDIPRPAAQGGGMEQRFWTAVHTPLADDSGETAYIVQNTVDVTDIARIRHAASLPFTSISGETRLLERAREAEQQHQTLLAESEEFRRLFQAAPGFFAVLSGPSHVFVFSNDAYARLVGARPLIGKPVGEALPEIVNQGFVDLLDGVYTTGKPAGGEAVRLMLKRVSGEPARETFVDFSYDAIRNRDGDITGVFVQGMDRTEAVRTQQRQKLLLDELNHRVKNTLATVQSIAAQTLRSTDDPAEAKARFEARLRALSSAHDILSEQEWTSASLSTILRQQVSAYGGSRIHADGPSVTLSPKSSIALALVTHELATNAARHGALASEDGELTVRWALDGERLVLDWEEESGHPPPPPAKRGFGSRLIERVVRGELGGEVEARYSATGFSCHIDVPHLQTDEMSR